MKNKYAVAILISCNLANTGICSEHATTAPSALIGQSPLALSLQQRQQQRGTLSPSSRTRHDGTLAEKKRALAPEGGTAATFVVGNEREERAQLAAKRLESFSAKEGELEAELKKLKKNEDEYRREASAASKDYDMQSHYSSVLNINEYAQRCVQKELEQLRRDRQTEEWIFKRGGRLTSGA